MRGYVFARSDGIGAAETARMASAEWAPHRAVSLAMAVGHTGDVRGTDGAAGSGTRSSSRRGLGRTAKRVIVGTTGTALLGVGAVMLVLPGPGLLVITGGLALLATEFSWAERRLQQARAYAGKAANAARRRRRRSTGDV